MSNKDYIFYINWEDRDKNSFRVGYLAQIQNEFYFVIRGKDKSGNESNEKSAYDRGFIGIPGFRPGEIYKSNELFDFFKNRILDKNSKDPCSELAQTKGISMIDSFYLEEIAERLFDKQKQVLLDAYEKQENVRNVQKENLQKSRQ